VPNPQATETEDDDLGASLEAAYDAQVEGVETESPETGTEPTSAPASAPSASSPAEASAAVDRARDAQGRFTKAELAQQAAAQQAQQPAEFKIPEKWPADVKAELQAIHQVNPQHAQFLVKQYEFMRGQASQALNRAQQEAQTHLKTYNDLLAPGRQQRALQGIDDSTYVRNLIAAGDVLDKNPEQGLRWLAQKYGVDLQQLVNPQAGGQQPEIPEWARAVQEKQNAIERFIASQAQHQEVQKVQMAGDWINQFASQKDNAGQALYPHFDDVLDEIIVNVDYQMRNGQQVDVDAAYKRAVRMNDSIWLKEQAVRSESARKADEARAKREIEEAKRASVSVSGSSASTSETAPDDLGKLLERNYERQTRR
jgi:hypothetical protein